MWLRVRCAVWRDGNLGVCPQWARERQRLGWKYVENCASERPLVQRFDNVAVDLQGTTTRIDEIGTTKRAVIFELAEEIEIENTLRRGRRRQQRDQDFGAPQEGSKAHGAKKSFDAWKRLLSTAPTRNLEPDAVQQRRSAGAKLPQAHDAHRHFACGRLLVLAP